MLSVAPTHFTFAQNFLDSICVSSDNLGFFAFYSQITWNYILQATNCKWIMLIFSLSEER